jgi:hypothetical protein
MISENLCYDIVTAELAHRKNLAKTNNYAPSRCQQEQESSGEGRRIMFRLAVVILLEGALSLWLSSEVFRAL